jgi:hypothetical protein
MTLHEQSHARRSMPLARMIRRTTPGWTAKVVSGGHSRLSLPFHLTERGRLEPGGQEQPPGEERDVEVVLPER